MFKAFSIFLKCLAILIGLHYAGLLVTSFLLNDYQQLPSDIENILANIFIAPEVIWSSPWIGILTKFDLMDGAHWKLPSLVGFAVVNAGYILVILIIRACFESIIPD